MRRVATVLGLIAVLVVAIVLGEVPPIKALAAWIDAHTAPLAIGVGVVIALGFALFIGGLLTLLQDRGRVLTHTEVEDVERSVRMAAQPVAWRASSYRVFGSAAGREGSESLALAELKVAWRSGAVWRDPAWRRRLVTIVGALLLLIGVCGLLVVIGPPWIKVLMAGALLYALGRLAWGWIRN
jgi:hypothetical protein